MSIKQPTSVSKSCLRAELEHVCPTVEAIQSKHARKHPIALVLWFAL